MSTVATVPWLTGAENGNGPAGAVPDADGTWCPGQVPLILSPATSAGLPTIESLSSA
jgi:hypothetical protein